MSEEAADTLRLHHCPECGYDLRGLPREGKCPECGFAYDAAMFSLRGERASMIAGIMGYLLIGLWGFLLLQSVSLKWGISFLAIWISILMIRIAAIRRRIRNDGEWIVFSKEGISVQRRLGRYRAVPWSNFVRLTYRPYGFLKKNGKSNWEIRLYREPTHSLHSDPRVRAAAGARIVFRLRASEVEARQIVAAIRGLAMQAWTGAPAANATTHSELNLHGAGFPLARE